jgi:hypothetical protein
MPRKKSVLQPPKGLSPAAQTIFQAIVKDYGIDCPAALSILTSALESHDRASEAKAILDREGPVVTDRWGQRKVHPAAAVERDSRAAYLSAIKALNLDLAVSDRGPGRPPGYGGDHED